MTTFLIISFFMNLFMFSVWTNKNFYNLSIKMMFGFMTVYSVVLLFPFLQNLMG